MGNSSKTLINTLILISSVGRLSVSSKQDAGIVDEPTTGPLLFLFSPNLPYMLEQDLNRESFEPIHSPL